MPYQIIIPRPVVKQLDLLPSTVREPVLRKIADLKEAPRPRGCVKLKGYEGEFRIRIGDYRIRYLVDDGQSIVVILHCLHRREAYRK
jgi:mRNA interferase RelE/StbE